MNAPERIDVGGRIPVTKEECEHLARYIWASRIVGRDTLDVACGTGFGSRVLAHRARVSGVDREPEAIAIARSRVDGAFLVADVPPIPFADRAFDFVVCFETIEHISDDREFLREVRRVLRPDGLLLISTPNKDISSVNGEPVNPWHVREYTLDSLVELLGSAGLTVREVYVQSFPPRIRRGHRFLWAAHGLTWVLPARVRAATSALLGDSEVRSRGNRQDAPGYWLATATRT